MNWYLESKETSDVVISTRIRFARNLAKYKFNTNDIQETVKIENEIKEKFYEMGYGLKFFKLKDMDDITKMSLVEKNIISPEFAVKKNDIGSILINDEENICIMLNEEDHLRIQVFNSSLALEETFNLAREIDERMQNIFYIAKNKKYGYLTVCPTNVGTGLRASVMVHLPALTKTGNISKILDNVSKFGMTIRGIYGENSKMTGDMYQISNKQTLGITEENIIKNLKIITEKIIDQERQARKYLAKTSLELEDKLYRSFGILSNCRKISSNEARELLSDVKLGTDLGIIKELTDYKVLQLYLYTKPANLQKYLGNEYGRLERDIKRAEVIKEILHQNDGKKEV